MAEWDTAYINDLPDSAFAVILPGGEKDADGKTVPRSLRRLPHHDAGGGIDMPHLRNAMSREPQADMPEGAHDRAHAHLMRHAEAEGMGKAMAPMKASLLDDDAFRLLAFPFGGPIPHPAYPRGVDIDAQTFSERTDIKADWFPSRLVDWFHGQDPRMGRAVLGKAVDLGRFEGKSAEPDADGWWVTVWLKRGSERVELVKRLAERATIYGSSETAPGLGSIKAVDGTIQPWRRSIPGEIVTWPYIRQTLAAIAQNTYSIIRPLKATLDDYIAEGEPPSGAFWSDLEDAMRDLGTDLRSTLALPGESAAKSGRVLSDEADLRAALVAASRALDRLETVVRAPTQTNEVPVP